MVKKYMKKNFPCAPRRKFCERAYVKLSLRRKGKVKKITKFSRQGVCFLRATDLEKVIFHSKIIITGGARGCQIRILIVHFFVKSF